jgi:hypothetical protein
MLPRQSLETRKKCHDTIFEGKEASATGEVCKMTRMEWFSAKVRTVCLVENHGATSYMDTVFIFRARNFQDALRRAIESGRRTEEEYLNAYQERVKWRLKEVISLDVIASESLDGAEVFSESFDVSENETIPFDSEFYPERSQPRHTGI